MTIIGEIIERVPCIHSSVKNKVVDQYFTENPKLQGIVIVENEKPVAHITRSHFYQKIGTLYGYNLYMGRETHLVAKKYPLIVEYYQLITDVSRQAMNRNEEDLYDDVIVTQNGLFKGIVTIKALLTRLVEIQVEFASYLNPLSKLPGNELINRNMEEMLNYKHFSLLYFDLDKFKIFNDVYGFKQGDKVLLLLTEILKKHIDKPGHFLGHIGGDDFMAILPHYNVSSLSEKIISEFDSRIVRYYKPEHLQDKDLLVKNRNGQLEKMSIVSLSIAVVTNQSQSFVGSEEISNLIASVKRSCKKVKGSCFLVNSFESDKCTMK